jgi:hypothetical protein
MKKFFSFLAILIIIVAIGQTYNLLPPINLEKYIKLPSISNSNKPNTGYEKQTVVYEESVITKVVEDSLPSVVTVGIKRIISSGGYIEINPFNPFSPFQQIPEKKTKC